MTQTVRKVSLLVYYVQDCARSARQVYDAYPSLTCCTQFQFEAGRPNTKPVVHSFNVSAVAPAQTRRVLLQARVQSKQGMFSA